MNRNQQLTFSSKAPDLTLFDTDGEPVLLSDFWKNRPLLLVFSRHFGCTQCKEMLQKFFTEKEKINQAGLNLVIVLQGTVKASTEFAAQFAPGIVCLADPDRNAYKAYGLQRGNLFQTFLNIKVWRAIRESRKKGFKVEPPPAGQDAMQMSGIFIISKEGNIELPYYFDHIADHPAIDLLLHGVLYTRWDQPFEGPIGQLASKDQE